MKESTNSRPKWAKGLNTRAYYAVLSIVGNSTGLYTDIKPGESVKKRHMIDAIFQKNPSLHFPGCGKLTKAIIYEWAGISTDHLASGLCAALHKEFPWIGSRRSIEIGVFCRIYLNNQQEQPS